MRTNLRTDAVFQRCDDLAARGVVLGIRAEDERNVQRQPHRVALNLHVAFLHDVEKSNLNLAREIGELVDGEDAAIGARKQPIVHGVFAAQFVSALRRFNGIDVADQVGDGHIGGRQLFYITLIRREVRNRRAIRVVGEQLATAAADRLVGIVVDLAAANVGKLWIEERGQGAQNTALGLTAQAKQNEIMARENGINDLRHDGVVISDNAGKDWATAAKACDEIVAQL